MWQNFWFHSPYIKTDSTNTKTMTEGTFFYWRVLQRVTVDATGRCCFPIKDERERACSSSSLVARRRQTRKDGLGHEQRKLFSPFRRRARTTTSASLTRRLASNPHAKSGTLNPAMGIWGNGALKSPYLVYLLGLLGFKCWWIMTNQSE